MKAFTRSQRYSADASGGGTAFPIAFMADCVSVIEGNIQSPGNPIIFAVSATFKHRTVSPSFVHQTNGCDAVCV